ncbi:MAG: hypothetical protein LUC92_05460 [Clostridiales bacterium]|nr:hypothetical protein [Clostridiales bacterium]
MEFDAVESAGTYYIITDSSASGTTHYASIAKTSSTEPYVSLTAEPTSIGVDEQSTVTATLKNVDENVTISNVSWKSSDTSVATVPDDAASSEVTVTGVGAGTTTITANVADSNSDTYTASTTITVTSSGTTEDYIAVEPTNNSDGSITYDFTSAGTGTLYNETNKTSKTTAYSNDATGCSVTLSQYGAELYDDSGESTSTATDKNKNASTLYVPYSASSGVINFTGSFKTKDNVGSKWNLVNFDVIAICTNGDKYLDFATSSSGLGKDTVAIAANTTYTYDVTINFNSGKASAKIYVDNTVVARFTNVSINSGGMSTISFTTNGSGNVTENSARTLVIPSVTITDISDEKEYVYFGITDNQAQSSSSYTISDFKSDITTGNQVYTGVNFGNGDIETSALSSYDNFIVSSGTDKSACTYVIAYVLDTATVDLDTLSIAFTALTTDNSSDSGDGSTDDTNEEVNEESSEESTETESSTEATTASDEETLSLTSANVEILSAVSADVGTVISEETTDNEADSDDTSDEDGSDDEVSDDSGSGDDGSGDDGSGSDGSSEDSGSDSSDSGSSAE